MDYQDTIRPGIRAQDLVADLSPLIDRWSKCCYCGRLERSRPDLPMFKYQGAGSFETENHCGFTRPATEDEKRRWKRDTIGCGFTPCAHEPINPLTGRPTDRDHAFVPQAAQEFDEHYDGCRGWN